MRFAICDLKSRWVRVPKSKIANLKAQMGEIENGLPIDIPAVADPDQMNDSVLRIDFVDHPVVAVSEGITAMFLSLERFALKGIGRQSLNERDESGNDEGVGPPELPEISSSSRIRLDPKARGGHVSARARK